MVYPSGITSIEEKRAPGIKLANIKYSTNSLLSQRFIKILDVQPRIPSICRSKTLLVRGWIFFVNTNNIKRILIIMVPPRTSCVMSKVFTFFHCSNGLTPYQKSATGGRWRFGGFRQKLPMCSSWSQTSWSQIQTLIGSVVRILSSNQRPPGPNQSHNSRVECQSRVASALYTPRHDETGLARQTA